MTWIIEREQTVWTIAAAGEPPQTVTGLLEDTWSWLFDCWCQDTGNRTAQDLHRMLVELQQQESPDSPEHLEMTARTHELLVEHLERFVADVKALEAQPPPEDIEPEWEYTGPKVTSLDDVREDVDTKNRWAFTSMRAGSPIEYRQAGTWVLLGEDHQPAHYDWAYNQGDYGGGTVTKLASEGADAAKVTRLAVTGSSNRAAFDTYMERVFGDRVTVEHTS